MRLLSARAANVGPFADLTFRFANDDGVARPAVVILGGGGTGKTSILSAIAQTRPGLAIALPRPRAPRNRETPFAVTEWSLGQDEPARPHPLFVVSPNATLGEDDDASLLRRREQAAFDRKAVESGFVLLAFSGARWFSRSPLVLTTPDRTLLRFDVRGPSSFDDATRADLSRETKQALVFGDIASRLEEGRGPSRFQGLARAMREAVSTLTALSSYRFVGADPSTLEPLFESDAGDSALFDDLPTSTRHLASFAALTVRALFAARGDVDPRAAEGVVLVDDVGLHQDARVASRLLPTLRAALPEVQWIVTTSQTSIATGAEDGAVLAIRRMTPSDPVELYDGPLAIVH